MKILEIKWYEFNGFKKFILIRKMRIVFEVQDDILTVYTIAVGQRDDMEVYKKPLIGFLKQIYKIKAKDENIDKKV